MATTIAVGLVAGRHPLPVDSYLLNGEVDASPSSASVRALHAALYRAVGQLPVVDHVELYLTGLTRAALLAVDMIRRRQPRALLTLMEYDSTTGTYQPTLFAARDSRLLPVQSQPLFPGE